MSELVESKPEHTDFAVLETAANWFALLQSDQATERDRSAWAEWLEAEPQHRAAWQRIEMVGARCRDLRAVDDNHEAITEALKADRVDSEARRRFIKSLGILAGVSVVGWAGWRHTPLESLTFALRADHRTGIGERQVLTLADGTQLWLNTATALDVDFTDQQRRLLLYQGEVLIETRSDPRAFIVETTQGHLRPIGTRFSIRVTDDNTLLGVYEGAVKITTDAKLTKDVPAGRQARFNAQAISSLTPADNATTSWVRGRLVANEMRLEAFIAELRRYRFGYVQLHPAVADLSVIGTFPTDDTDLALAMLEESLPVQVDRILPWWVSIKAK